MEICVSSLSVYFNNSVSYLDVVNSGSSGRVVVPLSSSALFSRMKNITGIHFPGNTEGISIIKLQQLNALIERLNRSKETSSMIPSADSGEKIEDILKEISDALDQNANGAADFSGSLYNSGSLVNFCA